MGHGQHDTRLLKHGTLLKLRPERCFPDRINVYKRRLRGHRRRRVQGENLGFGQWENDLGALALPNTGVAWAACGPVEGVAILAAPAPVAQRIEHRPPEPGAGVRVSPGVPALDNIKDLHAKVRSGSLIGAGSHPV